MKTSASHPRRRRRTQFLLALFLLPACAVSAAPAIEHWTTSNGARVYYVHAPELPMVDIQFIFDAGGARDGGRPGLARLTNALLDQGAGGLDADQIAQSLEQVGAQLSTSSHRDMAIVGLRSLIDPDLLGPATEVLARILGQPDFPAEALERQRRRMLVALKAQEESPGDIAQKAFYAALYGEHPYAAPPTGTEESLKALTRGEVRDYFHRYYVARNAVVAVVGALDRDQVASLVERLAGALAEGERAPALPPVTPLAGAVEKHIEFPSTQTHILMGQPGMKRKDADYFPLYVGNHVLGGSGLVSRISEEIREKRGLAYSAYSYFMPMREPGPYTLGLQTRNDKAGEALAVLRNTLQRFIDEGPTARELKASKRNITGGFPLRISSNGKIVSNLAMIGFYGLPLDYLETFTAHVKAVTRDQIRAAFQRRIHPGRMVTITVGQTPRDG
ncbi:MAG TPA: insulinase family protein [Gammaproteobacteria bacterium]|nr:insulinase family protein [Gammaproteobacteria bacterium]